MGHLEELPELALKRIFQFVFHSGHSCHDITSVSSIRALSSTCTKFKNLINTYDWRIKRLHINASTLQKRRSGRQRLLENLVLTKTKSVYDFAALCWLSRVNFLRNIEITIEDFNPDEAILLVQRLSKASGGINSVVFLHKQGHFFSDSGSRCKRLDCRWACHC